MSDLKSAGRYRFGVFEADALTGELRRQGIRVKLHAQPFQVLSMLLERPGELLTREEISRELWPDGTFVDYEHGVNSAVNRIREALGDSASNPRFVETLARRGYRFVAPVERIGVVAAEEDTAAPVPAASASDRPQPPGSTVDQPTSGRPQWRVLATPEELPTVSHPVVRTLFVLFQVMYLAFYVGALANLGEIADLFSALPQPELAMRVLIVSAALLIPVRAFLLSAVAMRPPGFRQNFLMLWWLLLVADELWALSPFLLLHHINFGLALACMALLVYSPFAQRSLMLMGADGANCREQA